MLCFLAVLGEPSDVFEKTAKKKGKFTVTQAALLK